MHAASFLLEITHQKVFYFNGKKVEERLIQRFWAISMNLNEPCNLILFYCTVPDPENISQCNQYRAFLWNSETFYYSTCICVGIISYVLRVNLQNRQFFLQASTNIVNYRWQFLDITETKRKWKFALVIRYICIISFWKSYFVAGNYVLLLSPQSDIFHISRFVWQNLPNLKTYVLCKERKMDAYAPCIKKILL